MKTLEAPMEDSSIHSPFSPAEVRPGDPVLAQISVPGTDWAPSGEVRVWRISPMGVELAVESMDLPVGTVIDLKMVIAKQVCEFSGLIVSGVNTEAGRKIVGVRWCQAQTQSTPAPDRRGAKRWLCGQEFMPTGVAANPVKFNDFVLFRVRDISAQGFQLLTSLRNKFLIPGMRLECVLSFPMVGQAKVEFKITNVRIVSLDGKDYLSLGAKILNEDPKLKEVVGQYVLQFGPSTTIEELRAEGFKILSTGGAIDYGYVRTAAEYREVLELRKLAYSEAGKIARDIPAEETSDVFDSRARILIARHRGKVVASLRLIYHEAEDRTEHEQFALFPHDFPRRDEMVEITRVCTHPDYRKSDLLYGLFKHAALAIVQSKRRWVLGSATTKLLPLYDKIGFKRTKIVYRHADLGDEEHTIFLGDVYAALAGEDVGPILWNAMYAELLNFVSQHDLVQFGPGVQSRLAVYRMLSPLARVLIERAMRKPRRK